MRRVLFALLALLTLSAFVACNHYETFGDKKEKQRKAIKEFIANQSITVISEDQFHAQGNTTDTARNEFVYMDNSAVYMQIVSRGCGTPLQDGESCTLLVRFMELCLIDSTALYNDTSPYDPDYLSVERTGNSFTAQFKQGTWFSAYGNSAYTSVAAPLGLLVPLSYINVGRARSEDDAIAKVRLIVPHSQGHTVAADYVYPYYYELTFQRQVDL